MNCITCNIECMKFGRPRNGFHRFRCGQCGKTYTEGRTGLFGSMTVPEEKSALGNSIITRRHEREKRRASKRIASGHDSSATGSHWRTLHEADG
jgi:transposase-like protein